MWSSHQTRSVVRLACWVLVAAGAHAAHALKLWPATTASGLTAMQLATIVAVILAGSDLLLLATQVNFQRRNKPPAEAAMVRRLYQLAGGIGVLVVFAYAFNVLSSVGSFFALFGGMLLGWSLQAPVSGFAAYLLVSLKRPFRPRDRVQFPNLGLTGDVVDIGAMYTVLDQVGGTIGSEEAVGRHILVPNAMLFSQVVINYTVLQEAAYMLDEVVVRITYDSKWDLAEGILIRAAESVTSDIIAATGVKPYIRSDLYDYGVYMRLRYQTPVKERAEIAYLLNKHIFEAIQREPLVDLAIPFVYSYRTVMDRREEAGSPAAATAPRDQEARAIQDVAVDAIQDGSPPADPQDVELLARAIASQGLLQPIIVVRRPDDTGFDVLAGHMRLLACKRLGWKTIPAVVRGAARDAPPAERPTS